MKKKHMLLLALLAAVLLGVAFPPSFIFTGAIFFAWIPLLYIAQRVKKTVSFFGYSFLTLFVWNGVTTWWIWNATDIGSVFAIALNALLMTVPWIGYHYLLRYENKTRAYIALIAFWMTFEYIHFNWDLNWPWLTLGNVLALHPNWIQWYEFTGVSGGTLWILMVNLILYECFFSIKNNMRTVASCKKYAYGCVCILPFLLSIGILLSNRKKENLKEKIAYNVLIIQPNVDPYSKFDMRTATQQVALLVAMLKNNVDSNTRLVLMPETAMSIAEWQPVLAQNQWYQPLFEFAKQHPQVAIVSGVETYKNYGSAQETTTARLAQDGNYYDAFNSAVGIQGIQALQFYNKSKLVPGVEALPNFFRFVTPLLEQFGGTTGGYGRSDSSKIFAFQNNPYRVAPIICYESIFGEYVASYVHRGANILTILTNDGWWGNTPGYQQHFAFARLRAIETRRFVARSANTGISCVINPFGEVLETRGWNTNATIKMDILPVADKQTFYVQHGNYLYKIAVLCSALLLLLRLVSYGSLRLQKRKKQA